MAEDSGGKKRKRQRRNPVYEGTYQVKRAIQCSLSRIANPDYLTLLRSIPEHVSQLRSLVSLVAKVHLYHIFETYGEPWFIPNQTYFNHIFSMMYDPEQRLTGFTDDEYVDETYFESLRQAVRTVNRVPLTPIFHHGHSIELKKTTLTKFTNEISRQLATGLRTHVTYQFERSLDCWVKNHLRSLMTEDEYNHDEQKTRKLMRDYYKDHPEEMPFLHDYTVYQQILDTLQVEENEEEEEAVSSEDIQKILYVMWKMRRDGELLERETGRAMNTITVIPQSAFEVVSIQMDTSALGFLKYDLDKRDSSKEDIASGVENARHQEQMWNSFFKLDEIRKLGRNKEHKRFSWTIQTDGVSASVLYDCSRRKMEKEDKRARVEIGELPSNLPCGLYSEKSILEKYSGSSEHNVFAPFDPGSRSAITVGSAMGDTIFDLSQAACKHGRGDGCTRKGKKKAKQNARSLGMTLKAYQKRNRRHKKKDAKKHGMSLKAYRRHLRNRNKHHQEEEWRFPTSVLPEHLLDYIGQVHRRWAILWNYQETQQDHKPTVKGLCRNKRRRKILRNARHRRFLERTVQAVKEKITVPGKTTVILFGNAGSRGGIRKGPTGPVLKLKRALARHFPVIGVDEFRTTKLCYECARTMEHPYRWDSVRGRHVRVEGVYFCRNTDHVHRTLNRDSDAARKIGHRFLMQLHRQDLGPWSRTFDHADLDQADFHGMCQDGLSHKILQSAP